MCMRRSALDDGRARVPEGYPGTRRLSAPPSSRSAAPPPRPLISFLRARCVNVNAPASLCLLCSKRKAPRAATGAQARPAREIRRRCACLPRARLFLVVGSRVAFFSGGGARLAHEKQARRATRTAGAASCVAALVGSSSSLTAHRGPICVVLITAHSGPDSRAACYVACCALPSRPVVVSGFVGLYPVLSGFIRFYPALVGFTALRWAFVGFRGFGWDLAPRSSLMWALAKGRVCACVNE